MNFKDWLEKREVSPLNFAKLVGKSHPTVYRWKNGISTPDMATIKIITSLTNGEVTALDFVPSD